MLLLRTIAPAALSLALLAPLPGRAQEMPRHSRNPALAQPARELDAEAWRQDLRHLAAELPKVHRNAFHAISRERWEAAVRRLDERIPGLRRHEIIVELSRLVALIGDGHTCFHSFYDPVVGFRRYPVSFYQFSDGLYVRAAAPRYRDAVGGRVVTIGKVPADRALAAAATVDGRDNELWSRLTAPWRLGTAEVVGALGLADDLERVPLTVERDGRRVTVVLTPEPVPEAERSSPALPAGWIDARGDRKLLWQQDPVSPYWTEALPARRALYVQWNAVQNGKGETLARFFQGVFDRAAGDDVDRLVIDLRNNGGGNNYLSPPVVRGIMRSAKLNARGRVFALIGRHTFSAAQNTVNWLKRWTDVVFVGEPTGSSPNQFGDAVPVRLPRSGLSPYVSTVWWQDIDERLPDRWVAPDLAVDMSGADYRRGVDPALEAALTAGAEPPLGERLRAALAAGAEAARLRELGRAYRADPRHRYASFEADLNVLGYELMGQGRLDAAVAVLELNAESFPRSANVWDSLAEALMNRGDRPRAVAYYRRSLALDPKNRNAAAMLEKLAASP